MENASKALIIAGAILISILLITIGITLINSGRDVVDTGTAGMQSQKIQTFNSQFTVYEGTRKGSELKNLVNVVNASNATDSEHQVGIWYYSNEGLVASGINNIKSSKTYSVDLFYATSSGGQISMNGWLIGGSPAGAVDGKTERGYIYAIMILSNN